MTSKQQFTPEELRFLASEMYRAISISDAPDPLCESIRTKAIAMLASPVETTALPHASAALKDFMAHLGEIMSMEDGATPADYLQRARDIRQWCHDHQSVETLNRVATAFYKRIAARVPGLLEQIEDVAKPLRVELGMENSPEEPTGKTIHFREDSRSGELLVADSPLKASTPLCGNPVMINSERYRGCQLASGHAGDCRNLSAEATQTYGSKAPAECNEGLGQSRERASNAGPGSSAPTPLTAEAARAYGEAMFQAGRLQQKESGK
jgi:hypothetical protein